MIRDPALRPNHPFVEFPFADTNQTIARRFEQQARRYPERLALKAGRRALSYAELNDAADQVARVLAGDADRGTPMAAVLCEAGVSMIVALLGALKAGRPFVPLNPRLPKFTLQEILGSLDPCLVLTDERNIDLAREIGGAGRRVLDVQHLEPIRARKNPALALSPDALAYINFTSGSTGAPKGVMWNHRSELFGIRSKTNALHIAPTDRISLLRANNVGAARDMFLALLNGAALIVLDLSQGGLASLADWLREEEISVFTCVATVFRQALSGAGKTRKFSTVRLIHIGGEPIFKSDLELYRRHFSDDCLFVSRYSISETQAVSYFFMNKRSRIAEDRVPVGYPLEGNEVAIVDGQGDPLGAREIGEIAVRSPYLALGYWREPELTRAKFLDDRAGAKTRTYLTGDLGYQLPDGCLVHVGRKDFQTKVKGHRVEVSAIEAALNQIPAIKQAVVIAQPDAAKGSRLIAYVVAKNSAAKIARLRTQLQSKLPAYMIPDSFVLRRRLPLNAAGKVDRSALPVPKRNQRGAARTLVEARNSVEKALALIWRDGLKIDAIGIDDDITQLGGDSLVEAQLVTKIAGLFPLTERLTNLFRTPTVAALARFIIDHETQPGQAEKIAEIFLQVEAMSDAEVLRAVENDGDPIGDG